MIEIFKLAWKNIWRNKRRTLLTFFAIAFGIIAVIFVRSYVLGISTSTCDSLIKNHLGHIKIAHKEYIRLQRVLPKEYLVTDSSQIKNIISGIPGIERLDERVKLNVLLSCRDANEPVVAVGVEPGSVDEVMGLSHLMVKGKYLDPSGLNLIIGDTLARTLNVTVNDELLLVTSDINYSTYALPFKISGIFATGYPSIDRSILYIPLQKAREMLDCGDASHEILVFLKDPGKAVDVAKIIEPLLREKKAAHQLSIIPWQDDDFVKNLIPILENVLDKVLFLIMMIAGLVILNTMLMSVMERYHEMGVLKALGLKNREIFYMIVIEAFYIGVLSSVAGGGVGGILAGVSEKIGLNFAETLGNKVWDQLEIPFPAFGKIIYPDLTFSILIGSVIFGIVIALVAALYPAVKSSKMEPVSAFRKRLRV